MTFLFLCSLFRADSLPSRNRAATCRIGGRKIPCAVPHLIHGAGPLYANVTGLLVDVGSGCKSMKQSGSGQIALVVKSGRCSFHKMAQKAQFADFEGLVVIESAKFKGKKKIGEKELGLPVAVIQEKEFKKIKKLLPDASSASRTGIRKSHSANLRYVSGN